MIQNLNLFAETVELRFQQASLSALHGHNELVDLDLCAWVFNPLHFTHNGPVSRWGWLQYQ